VKNYIPRLFNTYKKEIQQSLKEKLNIDNVMQLPRIEKIVLNIGMGDAKDNKNSLSQAIEELKIITGQRPVITKAKNAISNFKIRMGDPVGVKVTLRNIKMYEFLDRFISVASPRIRDFRGLSSKGFDRNGNYNFGISEQIVFPEIDYDKVNSIRGMNVTIVTNAINNKHAHELLLSFGFPINELKTNNLKEVPVEQIPSEEPTKEDLSEEAAAEEIIIEETPQEELTEETLAEEATVEESPEEVASEEEIPSEEPTKEDPSEEVATEETITEETPTETKSDEKTSIEEANGEKV
jgi:large subunit ribosomal protein L5